MAEPGTFKLNHATIARIAKYDHGLAAAVDAAAEAVRAEVQGARAHVAHYTTDRHVAGVLVNAVDQAKHGALTRALGSLGGRLVQHD